MSTFVVHCVMSFLMLESFSLRSLICIKSHTSQTFIIKSKWWYTWHVWWMVPLTIISPRMLYILNQSQEAVQTEVHYFCPHVHNLKRISVCLLLSCGWCIQPITVPLNSTFTSEMREHKRRDESLNWYIGCWDGTEIEMPLPDENWWSQWSDETRRRSRDSFSNVSWGGQHLTFI